MLHELLYLMNLDLKGGDYDENLYLTGNLFTRRRAESVKTPAEVALQLIGKMELSHPGLHILEPCAGQGGIVEQLLAVTSRHKVWYNDINAGQKKDLLHRFHTQAAALDHDDSLEVRGKYYQKFDCVVMNPPFNKAIDFVDRMLSSYLKEDGQLITLFPTLQLARLQRNHILMAHLFAASRVEIERVQGFDCAYGAKVSLLNIVKK
jgi:16S rRNA G1207 methylase RsmC